MSTLIETQLGEALPPQPHHSITVHLPKWDSIVRFADRDPTLMGALKSMYPRMIQHQDVKQLIQKFLLLGGYDPKTHICAPYTSPITATQCKEFATSPKRGEDAASPSEIDIKVIDVDIRYYVVFFPLAKLPVAHPFWMHSGLGTPSRKAEESLKYIDQAVIVEDETRKPAPVVEKVQEHFVIRERIANLLERAPAPGRVVKEKVSPDDVYLFQTGMASIYSLHRWLIEQYNNEAQSILFGFAFHHTIHVFNFFGPGYKFLGNGDEKDIEELEKWLKEEKAAGRKVQALWAEYPSNPLVVTPNLRRLRELGDEYEFLVIIDDTIGSFCNVDVLAFADVVVTSLTKSFNGYADVMGASAVINPASSSYGGLKGLFEKNYRHEYPNGDAIQLEKNSRTYLERSTVLNNNALKFVQYFEGQASDPESPVSGVFYTTVGPSLKYYRETMRQPTADFEPGYGCLFTVELKSEKHTIAFFDNLNVHHGPHLGAHMTLALPYTRALYSKDLEWAAGYSMRPTQIRVAVGLEDANLLLETFKLAVGAAQAVKEEE